jgi:DNA replication protein DnaC
LLTHPTLDLLHHLGLNGMAKAFGEIEASAEAATLTHPEWLALLLDQEVSYRRDRRLLARLRYARLRHQAAVEDVDYRAARGLDRALFQKLAEGSWIDVHENLILCGPTGVGKSWLSSALGHKACRDNRSVLYQRIPKLFADLALARGDGRYARILRALGGVQLLILDDWGLQPLDAAARHDLLEILEERYGRRSTIITSQIPVDKWHELIGDPTYADAILDRIDTTHTGSISPATACDALVPTKHPRIDRTTTECQKLFASEAPDPGRHHVGILGDIIPESPGGFVGIRSWVHKTANVLDKLPKSQQSKAKRALQEIWMAETKKDALAAFDAFVETRGVKYERAVECLTKDREALLALKPLPPDPARYQDSAIARDMISNFILPNPSNRRPSG